MVSYSELMDIQRIKSQFPILDKRINGHSLVYLDNAATTQKPTQVIESITTLYEQSNANVHRGSHQLASECTTLYEQARAKVQSFINANAVEEIIWTSGTTQAINMLACGLEYLAKPGDEIVISEAEHHANLVPWQQLAHRTSAKLVVIPVDNTGTLTEHWQAYISSRCILVAINYASNVTGIINPIEQLIAAAKQQGALTVIDAAQAVAHLSIDVQQLDCDFLCFSGHKMYAPTGIGVLYGKKSSLDKLSPVIFGGEMVASVSIEQSTFANLPHRLESGTPNYEAAIALGAAVDFLQSIDSEKYLQQEKAIVDWLQQQLHMIPQVNLLGSANHKLPIITFTIDDIHPIDVAMALNNQGIAVRAGHHCAMPLLKKLTGKEQGAVRASFALYNDLLDAKKLVSAISSIITQHEDIESGSIPAKQKFPPVALLEQKFRKNRSWDFQYRELLRMGKQLAPIPASYKRDENLIAGCESRVWLVIDTTDDQEPTYWIDSDTKIVRGLILMLQSYLQSLRKEQVKHFDFHQRFKELGFVNHLSPSRVSGISALIAAIKHSL